ncbi:MAG: PQQ-like beta-propeller repeat protein, partial [Planctomycetales bacterium]|nr:PQQ-like beta-propeller repeat protein [Planctomycetales bacterium]
MQNHRHPRRRCFLLFATTLIFFARGAEADDWPQWRGPHRDGVWREDGIVASLPEGQIPIKWRTSIGPGYSGPTVANGQVLVTDRIKEPDQIERIHCFAESDGTKLWTVEYACPYIDVGYEAGPRASVTIDNHVAYSLGTMGHLHAIDSQTGNVIWKRQLQEDYQISMPIWGIAAAPLIYQDLIIVHIGGADGACVVALNKQTGKEAWKALNDKASYSAPIIIQQNQQDVLICWTGDNVAALDPNNGQVHWTSPMPPSRMVIGIATPVVEDNRIFVTSFYDGSKMVQFDPNSFTATELWRSVG